MKINLKRILIILTILTVVLFLTHYFIFISVSRSLDLESLKFSLALLLTLGSVSIPLGFILSLSRFKTKWKFLTWTGYIWMGFFHILFFLCLIEFFLALVLNHPYSYWTFIFAGVIGCWALFKGLQYPKIIHHQINGPVSLKGLRLAHVSDLHVGLLHLNEKWLQKIVNSINELNADFVAITGDLVEGKFADVSPQLACLDQVQAQIEKFYITGNHEYIHGIDPWEQRLTELSYKVLHNSNSIHTFNQTKILFGGVPDRMVRRFHSTLQSLPDVALKTSEKVDYRILLAHEPSSLWDLKTEPCDLILSGHTHGGQIFPFGLLVRIVQPVIKGFKTFGSTKIFVHQGTGLWGPPMRWFSRSEIVLLTWV